MNSDCTTYHCPVDATLDMIGGKYKALILWHLIGNTLRFGELRKLIPQATPKMLTQTASGTGGRSADHPYRISGSAAKGGVYAFRSWKQYPSYSGNHV